MASEKNGEIISGSSSSCIIQVDDDLTINEEDILDVGNAWIFRVSKPLRDSDRFYSPKLVSIGPFHYGKKELKGMEKSKSEAVRRMQKRIQRYDPRASIKSFVEEHVLIKDKEIRKFYGEHIPFLPIKLAWMVARDACFLFEFLVNYVQWSNEAKSLLKEEVTVFSWKYDAVFDVGYQNPMRETLMDDILLLENQILLWVLKDLLEIRMGSPQAANQKLDELMELLLRRAVGQGIFMWNDYDSHNISCHVLEVVYHGMVGNNVDSYNDGEALEMPPSPSSMQICFEKTVDSMKTIFGRSCKLCMRFSSSNRSHGEAQQTLSSPHNRMQIWFKKGVDSMRAICGKMCLGLHSSNTRGEAVNLFFLKPPTALELTRAGVKIHPVTFENRPREVGSGIQWIRFYEKTSTLYLPQMKVTLQSDSVLRNMIAMEVSIEERYRPRPMTQFVMFMDELIDSEEDVAVLRKAEVIKNFLGSNQQVADLFNSLSKGITTAEGCKGSLSPSSPVCEKAQNCGIIFRPTCRRAINGVKQCKFQFRIYCSGKGRHRSPHKKYTRESFRSSSIEDAVITSWVLYNYDDEKHRPISSKPTSPGYENSEALADNNQTTNSVANAQGKKRRRNSRVGNPSLSLSQSFDGHTNSGYIIGATGPPAALSKPFAGGAGLYMALVLALLGITTAGASLLGMNSSQEECTKCSGYGVERCHLCHSTGTIKCELDSVHFIACPLCYGSLMIKCSSCDGVRIRKGVPPFMQPEQARSSQRSRK